MKTKLNFIVTENQPAFEEWPKYRIDTADGITVAAVFGEENVKLGSVFAAAPELLEALKSTLLYIETYGGEVTSNFAGTGNENLNHYKALLNKAEGE